MAAGAVGAALGLSRRSWPGLVCAALGGALIYHGFAGRSPLTPLFRLGRDEEDREQPQQRGVQIAVAFTINRTSEQLYQFWRNFENLPQFMSHLQRVTVTGDRRSHWVAKAPVFVGGEVEWDAEVTRDEPNHLIEWRSLPDSTIETQGQVRFERALGDRGTEVHVYMRYTPPGGRLGHMIAALSGKNPKRVIREDLRNFKRLMELGEILTITGQPHGTCTGEGKPYSESDWKPMIS